MRATTDIDMADDRDARSPETEAVDWHVKVASGAMSRAEQERFTVWLRQEPANADAYARLAAMWDNMGALANSRTVQDGLRDARRFGTRGAVNPAALLRKAWNVNGAPVALAAMVLVVVAAAIVFAFGVSPFGAEIYRTGVGQQREITLADGSVVMLNTATVIDVDYSAAERRVTLLDGQANFDVAHDPDRAFVVYAGDALVRAIGTEFEIYKSEDVVTVTLLEGRIEVASAALLSREEKKLDLGVSAPPPERAELAPGEQVAIAAAGALSPVVNVDIGRFAAWREGKVNFRNTPLSEAVAEMNRYSTVKITLADADLAGLRVSGVFRIGDGSDRFVGALQSLFDVRVEKRARGEIVILQAPGA
jgi:transmembrane sensor